jgi:beta-mannosidase
MKGRLSIAFLILSLLSQAQTIQMLHAGWEFKMDSPDQVWRPAEVPGTVHQDLMKQGQIEDIYYENNELRYQWIETKNWLYRTEFTIPAGAGPQTLVFEGLDTYARIFLNDSLLGFASNMFRQWEFDLKGFPAGKHRLRIEFISPYKHLRKKVEEYPYQLPAGSEKGALKVSPFCRKAAYHFGWDWAPRVVTAGVYRKVYLRSQGPYIKGITTSVLAIRDSTVFVQWDYDIEGAQEGYQIELQSQRFDLERITSDGSQFAPLRKAIRKARLWWPHTHGEPYLYHDTLRLYKGDSLIDTHPFKYALRTVELVQEADSLGTPFYFKINGKAIFARGANYIPQDMLLPRVKDQQYRRLLLQAKAANMNMLRVWGGGVYEKEIFYRLCDSLGIMVWQDFMFAGTMYPANEQGFLANVSAELEDNIQRLSKHPCIVLWCGNNEIEVAWKNWGWQKQYGYSKADSTILWRAYLSLFDSLIPQKLKAFDSNPRPYVHTSPLSNWGRAENFKHGSMHYWGVWHGGDNFEAFADNVGRFMVEYGFQSFPDYRNLRRVISLENMHLHSEVMQNRQKSYVGNQEILRQVKRYYSEPVDFEQFIVLSQKVQQKALKQAIAAHRTQQGYCMGSLIWQLNDCWPGPSWSIIDYYGQEKAAYQTVRQGFGKNYWRVDGPVLIFVVEEALELNLTLRYRSPAKTTESISISKAFTAPGVYRINLEEEPATKQAQRDLELRYIEALFSNE